MNAAPLSTRVALGFGFLGLGLLLSPVMSSGFDNKTTHRDLTRVSIRASGLDQFLKTTLRLDQGVNAPLSGAAMSQAISRWLEDGSQLEDEPDCRASNHFHNPLKPFSEAGVSDLDAVGLWCWATTEYKPVHSNVTWGTGFTAAQAQGSGTTRNQFDWTAARTAYLNALRASAPSDREAALAQTFLTLGYILHLVQDLAVPAHVRDDFQSHLADCRVDLNQPVTSWCGNSLEIYLRDNGAFVQEVLTRIAPTQITFQDAYVTRFWDTDQFTGTNPSADTAQGLAEYVNANFASPNTIFTEGKLPGERYRFLYPAKTSTNLTAVQAKSVDALQPCLAPDGRTDKGWYATKYTHGEVVPYFAKGSYLYHNAVQTYPPPPQELLLQLDQCVHRSYADRLLPRAVGYSAGLLNYFFRGALDFQVKVAKDAQGQDDPNKRELTIINASREQMEGRFSLYAEDAAGVRRRIDNVVGLTDAIPLVPGATTSEQITFVPLDQVAVKAYVLVFNGKLGNEGAVSTEEDAVGAIAGKVKPWERAVVFAVQETAAFTGEEKQSSADNGYEGWRSRFKTDATKQRAAGHFVVPGESAPGKYIKAIRLAMDFPPDPGATDQVILRLTDSATGSRVRADGEWSRDSAAEPPFNPDQWEIELNLPDMGGRRWDYGLQEYVDAPRHPRFMEIETLTGAKWKTPLIWWSSAQASGHAEVRKYDTCGSWPTYTCREVSSTDTLIYATVFFGDGNPSGLDLRDRKPGEWDPLGGHFPYDPLDEQNKHTRVGFVPMGNVGGYGVGTIAHTSTGWPPDPFAYGACPTGALTATSVDLFATAYGYDATPVWRKHTVSVSQGRGIAVQKDTICQFPALPPVPDPPALPDLVFQRDYLPAEQAQFQELGVTPPEYTVRLTIQAQPTP